MRGFVVKANAKCFVQNYLKYNTDKTILQLCKASLSAIL